MRFLVVASGAALLLAGCEPAPRREIVGRWTGSNGEAEFFRTGRVLVKANGQPAVPGRYEFVERDRMLVVWEGELAQAPPADYRVAFTGRTLILCHTDRRTECISYSRAQDRGGD